jgi:hypothetical protein
MATKNTVVIDFDIEGFHHYPNAPVKVAFLRHNHRHLFNVRVHYKVLGLDREKEIFIQEAYIKEYLNESFGVPCQFGAMSCEMIAQEIIDFGKEDGITKVEVYEDGKGGAIVEL